jgi:uncharacterized protein YPO0396
MGILRAELDERVADLRRLRDMLDGPRVRAIAHYARHHRQLTAECDDLYEAVEFLQSGLDGGELSPIGVSVGGRMYPWDELEGE